VAVVAGQDIGHWQVALVLLDRETTAATQVQAKKDQVVEVVPAQSALMDPLVHRCTPVEVAAMEQQVLSLEQA
jgi:hypothetical protein